MKSAPLVASLALNFLLALTIANIYVSDRYFQDWVSVTIGPLSPFLVLTLAVGGGSGLGYLFLQRKHPDQRISTKLSKTRFPKPGVAVGSLTVGRAVPSSASQGAIPRQVAYAVPPPAASPKSPGISKPSMSLSVAPKPSMGPVPPSPYARNEQQSIPPGVKRPDLQQPNLVQPPVQGKSPGPAQWQQDQRIPFPVKSDVPGRQPIQAGGGPMFQTSANSMPQQSPAMPQTNRPPVGGPQSPGQIQVPQKWQPPGQTVPAPIPGQPRQEIDPSQKWAPLPNRPFGQQTPPPPTVITSTQGPFRPNPPGPQPMPLPRVQQPTSPPPGQQGQFAPRPLGPPLQRPIAPPFSTQGPSLPRQGELGPVAVPRQFRPEPDRPIGQQPTRSPVTPQPWAPAQSSSPPPAKPRPSENIPSTVFPKPSPTDAPSVQVPRPSEALQKSTEASQPGSATGTTTTTNTESAASGSEMDWDTALDTILKTLRRDRIRDEQ